VLNHFHTIFPFASSFKYVVEGNETNVLNLPWLKFWTSVAVKLTHSWHSKNTYLTKIYHSADWTLQATLIVPSTQLCWVETQTLSIHECAVCISPGVLRHSKIDYVVVPTHAPTPTTTHKPTTTPTTTPTNLPQHTPTPTLHHQHPPHSLEWTCEVLITLIQYIHIIIGLGIGGFWIELIHPRINLSWN